MGGRGTFFVGGLPISDTEKDEVEWPVLDLFRAGDRAVTVVRAADLPARAYSNLDTFQPEDPITVIRYACSVRAARHRLELAGVTLDACDRAFTRARDARYDRWAQYATGEDEASRGYRAMVRRRRRITFDGWLWAVRDVFLGVRRRSEAYRTVREGFKLKRDWLGFPGYDPRFCIRAVLELFDQADDVVDVAYDITDVGLSGNLDGPEWALEVSDAQIADAAEARRIVVLTEGTSDARAIESALRILYPAIADDFAFLDFEGARLGGGAGALANLVKAFVAAGIRNRIVALFDNDTAGRDALRTLEQVRLPATMRVVRYPDLALASAYPTLGPTGLACMNVNGLAAGLELYFGEDVLRGDDGALTPVQWRGYNDGMKQYQGEVLQKSALQATYTEKVRRADEGSTGDATGDWAGMHAIIDVLRSAFQAADTEALLHDYSLWSGA